MTAEIPIITPDGTSLPPIEELTTVAPLPDLPGMVNSGFSIVIPRTRHTATLLKNGKILIAGGSVEGDDFALDEEIIDPVTGISSWAAPMHTVRHDHSATLLDDGRVLVVGGYSLPQQWLGDAEIYDPISDRWTVFRPNYSHGSAHSATLMKDGRVLLTGGCIGSGDCTELVEIFDPRINRWSVTTPLQEDRWAQTTQFLENGRVLVAGGVTAGGNTPVDGSALTYDPSTDTWGTTQPMDTPRFYAESVKLKDGDVLVAGGLLAGSHPPITTNTVEIYDPDTNTWRTVAPLAKARYAFILKLLPNGQVIAMSGAREWDDSWTQDSFVKEIELFDPVTGQWRVIGDIPEPSAFATGILLNNGHIWVAGGQVGELVMENTWLIQP